LNFRDLSVRYYFQSGITKLTDTHYSLFVKAIPLEVEVEFSNNGITDSLTGAPAPKLFLDNLAREIAKSKRKFQAISIITVKVTLGSNQNKVQGKDFSRNSLKNNERGLDAKNRFKGFEKELILVGLTIRSKIRSGDFYSRFAENGFWVCIQGDIEDAKKTSERFSSSFSSAKESSKEEVSINFSEIEWDLNMELSDLILYVDLSYFTS